MSDMAEIATRQASRNAGRFQMQIGRNKRQETKRKGTGSGLTCRILTLGPILAHPSSSITSVRLDPSAGLSFLASSSPKRESCVETRSCRLSFVFRSRSTIPRRFISSRLCSGSSRIAIGSGGFGDPRLSARKTDTPSALTCELESTVPGEALVLSVIGSLTTVEAALCL